MSHRVDSWPVDELLRFADATEISTDLLESPEVHPVLIDETRRTILRGYNRLIYAAENGIQNVPVIALGQVGPRTREAYLEADSRLEQCKGWSEADLKAEWERLLDDSGV